MFSKRSIRASFLIQLLFSSASLILIFSSFLYFYIEKSIYDEKRLELLQYAKNISNDRSIMHVDEYLLPDDFLSLDVEIVHLKSDPLEVDLYESTRNKHTYLTLLYPFNISDESYLKVTKEITLTKILLNKKL